MGAVGFSMEVEHSFEASLLILQEEETGDHFMWQCYVFHLTLCSSTMWCVCFFNCMFRLEIELLLCSELTL